MIRDVNVHIYAFGGEFYNHVTYASLDIFLSIMLISVIILKSRLYQQAPVV